MNPSPPTAHLVATQFKPGNTLGGRRKRPQSEANEDRLRMPMDKPTLKRLKEKGYEFPPGATVADGIAFAMSLKALGGDVNAARELRESVEGKSKIRVEVEDKTKKQPRLVVQFAGPIPEKITVGAELPRPALDVAAREVLAEAVREEDGESVADSTAISSGESRDNNS